MNNCMTPPCAAPHASAARPRAALAITLLVALLATGTARGTAGAQEPIAVSLGAAARLAAERAPAAEAAGHRAAQADARARQRRADLLPALSLMAVENERTFNSSSLGISVAVPGASRPLFDPDGQRLGPVRNWDLRGTIRQNLLDPAAFARLRAARAAATAGSTEASGARQQAAAIAAAAYVRALGADAQIGARMDDSTLAAQLLEMARDRLAAGTADALDVTRARSQLAGMRSQLIAARRERDQARIELAVALGLPPDAPITLTDGLPTGAAPAGATAESDAIATATTRRSDLRALDEQREASEQHVRAIRAERLPALSLYADQGSAGKDPSNLLGTYSWGIQLSLPVFDGFRREARLDEQRWATRELDARRRDAATRTAADVRSALVALRAAGDQLDAASERFTLAEQELGIARERFAAGIAGNADVVIASLALNAARTQLTDARTTLLSARVALARAQGTVTDLP